MEITSSQVTIKKRNLALWLIILLFYLVMELSYYYFIFPYHGYNGYLYEFDISRFLVAKIFFLSEIFFIHLFIRNLFLFGFSYLLIGLFLCPNLILYQYMDSPPYLFIGIGSIPIFLGLMQNVTLRFRFPRISARRQNIALVVISLILLIPFLYAFGLNLNFGLLNLETVYIYRKEIADMGNILTSYLYSWLSYWIFPFLILIGINDKKKGLLILGLFGMLYLFFATGNKITFFLVFAAIGFSFFNTIYKKVFSFYLFLTTLFLSGLLIALIYKINFIQDFLVGRFLFLPALLNIQYHEYFEGQKLMLSYSFLSFLNEYPYHVLPARLIGMEYYLPETNSTNGIISDGYINFGVPGIFIFTFLASLIVLYSSQMRLSSKFFGVYFILLLIYMESALFTSLLTHGIIFFLLLSTFFLKDTNEHTGS